MLIRSSCWIGCGWRVRDWQVYSINQLQKTVMGNSHFVIPSDLSSEWVQTNCNGKVIIRNTISQQNFTIHHISRDSSTNAKEYLRRSIYSLPHTPRIIVLEETNDSLHLLVQQATTHLKFLLRKLNLLIEVLQLVKDLVGVAQQLKAKYGAFQVSEELVGVLKNDEICMWINSKFEANEPQTPLLNLKNDEEAMISSIVKLCQKHCRFNLAFLQPQHPTTFPQFINHLAIKIEIEKLKITHKNMPPQQPKNRNSSSNNINSTLKTFDRKCNIQPSGFDKKHRKQLTMAQEQSTIASATPNKKFTRRVTSQGLFEPFAEEICENSPSKHDLPFQYSQATIPTINLKHSPVKHNHPFTESKATGISTPSPITPPTTQEVTFCQPHFRKQSSWDLKKRITCSTQQNIDNFTDSYRRQSSIMWVEEPLVGQKSLIEDYHCLFAKTATHLPRKGNQEEFYKFQK